MQRSKSLPQPSMGLIFSLLLLGAMVTLTGCNTVSGFGRDVESAGDAVSDTAEDVAD